MASAPRLPLVQAGINFPSVPTLYLAFYLSQSMSAWFRLGIGLAGVMLVAFSPSSQVQIVSVSKYQMTFL